jgi:membrane-associated phospholipid phosphatase
MLKFFVIVAISIPLAALSLAGQGLTEPSPSEPSPSEPSVAKQGIDSPSASAVTSEPAEQTNSTEPEPSPDSTQTAAGQEANRSVVKPKPGGEVIKPKDLYDATGYFHPFVRMPNYIWQDQKAIWTSPFHTSKKEMKWWFIFGGATGALIATDKYVSRNAPNNPTLKTLGNDVSYLGEAYTLIPIASGFYFLGTAYGDDHFREAGLLSFEALADVTIMQVGMKSIADRQRPTEGNGSGRFEASTGARYSSSFPSGHGIETFAIASIFAHEYPHKLWVKILVYAYAGGVVGARLAAKQHFPGDVMAGGAMGWFVGDFVYGKRHNSELDKPTITRKILDHVQISFGYPTGP